MTNYGIKKRRNGASCRAYTEGKMNDKGIRNIREDYNMLLLSVEHLSRVIILTEHSSAYCVRCQSSSAAT